MWARQCRSFVAILIFGMICQGTVDVMAQEVQSSFHNVSRRIDSFSPGIGRAGTTVTLTTGGMPAITPVRIGIGATQVGFEEIGQALTTERGELTIDVEVPDWADPSFAHVFIVFDFYFAPIALSSEFFVLGPDGNVSREGRIMNDVPECEAPALLTDDGILYALTGDLEEFVAGDRVAVEGKISISSLCARDAGIEVTGIQAGGELSP
ncbi:MAG: DUF5818 domain-containing protein [Longimicrobiales bacterium]|jgi:hypothetical protein